jgi:hypothetical protein
VKNGDLIINKQADEVPELRDLAGIIISRIKPKTDDPFEKGFLVLWNDGISHWSSEDYILSSYELVQTLD